MNSPELIRANVLLAQGQRSEAKQWLNAHLKAYPDDGQHLQMLWLQAQTAGSPKERLTLLKTVVRGGQADNPYVQLARESLAIEARYAPAPPVNWRTRLMTIGLVSIAVIALGWGAINLFVPQNQQVASVATIESTAEVTLEPEPTLLPSNPETVLIAPIVYDAGQLQVVAIEDGSQAVVSRITGEQLKPITGAQFYVVYVSFECRIGICNVPPMATIALISSDGFVFAPREDVRVQGAEQFTPVALGIPTNGVVVFEMPVIGVPETLLITPAIEGATLLEISLLEALP